MAADVMQIKRIREFRDAMVKAHQPDPERDFGPVWIYGVTLKEECLWCRALYDSLEGAS